MGILSSFAESWQLAILQNPVLLLAAWFQLSHKSAQNSIYKMDHLSEESTYNSIVIVPELHLSDASLLTCPLGYSFKLS
jgi:hypothetical protein